MKKKLMLCVVICLTLLTISSCNPSAKYTMIEVFYDDVLLNESYLQEFQESILQKGYSINYNKGEGVLEYKNENKKKFDLNIKGRIIIDFNLIENDGKNYLVIPVFKNKGPGEVKRYKYSYGGIVIAESGDFYQFKKGEIPLTIKENYIYFFSDISIYRRDIDSQEDTIVCSLPYDKFPIEYTYENSSDYTSPDFIFNEYRIMVGENNIEIVGHQWIDNKHVDLVLAETKI